MVLSAVHNIVKGLNLKLRVALYFFLVVGNLLNAQKLTGEKIKVLANEKFLNAVQILNEFLSIPNDSHFPNQITNNLK